MSTGRAPSVVTFLFTDIVGSTQLTDALGDEGGQEIVRLHNSLVRSEVARHGGSEVKTMGDGFMIAFQSVSAALQCSVAIQLAIAQHNKENPTREFMVRMGLNAGEAIQEEDDFFGAAVIVAARINSLADGGEILSSEAVRQLAQGVRGIEFKLKGEFQLKGLREAHRVYKVIPAGQVDVLTLRRARFVGRAKEMDELRACVDQASAGSGLFVVVRGEAGVGKTRLADEITREARARGFRVWRGRCSGTEGAPPYLPFLDILRQYVDERPDDVLLDELGDEAAEIAKLVPEISRRVPVRGDSVPLPPEQERYRLLEAVRGLFEHLSRRRPLMLVLEDMHWADAASCLLLQHLAPTLSATPMLILATAREEEIPAGHQLTQTFGEFGRVQAFRSINLSGLGINELEEMLASLGAGTPPAGLAESIFQDTEGNAFFVTELIAHLHTERLLFSEEGVWKKDLSAARRDVPHSVRAVVQRRLESASADVRQVLALAAVIGREFSYDVIEALEGPDADVLLDALDEGMRLGMIEQVERTAADFRFTHHLIQQTLYDEVPVMRRQRSHLRVGEALEQRAVAAPEELAHHFSRAGMIAPMERTRKYLVLAGEKARTVAAWQEAAEYFRQALELALEVEPGERARLLWRLGEAEGGSGDWEGAVTSLKEAMDLFEELGDTESLAWIAYSLRRLYGARGQFTEAAEVVQRGLVALGDSESQVRSRLLAQAGFIRSAFGDVAEAESLLAQSREIAERTGELAATGFTAFITGMHCLSYCRLQEAADWLMKAAEWSTAGRDPWSASQASSFRRHILFTLGRLDEAESAMEEEERLARKAGNFLAVCETKWISSGIACLRGQLETAEELGRELLRLIDVAHADSGVPGAMINLSYIRFLRGDTEAYEDLLARAVEVYDRMSAAPIDDPRPVVVLLRALSGRTDSAVSLIPQLERYFRSDEEWTSSLAEARTTLASALAVLGDRDGAERLYGPLKEWTASAGYVLTGASSIPQLVKRALGMAASVIGAEGEAAEHFEAAIQEAIHMNANAELAECHYWYARHLLAGNGAGAQNGGAEHASRAIEIWQQLDMHQQVHRAQALLPGA